MGVGLEVRCNVCEKKFIVENGGGPDYYLLHCDRCGDAKRITLSELSQAKSSDTIAETFDERVEKLAGKCNKCDGVYKLDAPARCPNCQSKEYSEIVSNGKVTRILYD